MTNETTAPAYPAPTGDAFADSRARAEHFQKLCAHFEAHPPSGPVSLTVATAAQPATGPAPVDKVAAFDQEMRAAGLQIRSDTPTAGEVDQGALTYLDNLRRTTPRTEQTSQWLTVWEREYGQVLEGRRLYESVESWQARCKGTAAKPAEATPPELATDGYASADQVNKSEDICQGYQLPDTGEQYNIEETTAMCRFAKSNGITQVQLNAYLAEIQAR